LFDATGGALALLLAMVQICTGMSAGGNTHPVVPARSVFESGNPDPLPGWLLFKFFPLYAKLRALCVLESSSCYSFARQLEWVRRI
jgi:hypothetical protein